MPKATRTETWQAPIEKIYSVLTDYEKYPEFVDGCSEVEVLNNDNAGAKVQFYLNFIKKFKYILNLTHKENESVSWELDSGDIFKKNSGSWLLEKVDDSTTKVHYTLEVEIKGFAPKSLVNTLTEKNLPAMLASYHEQAKK